MRGLKGFIKMTFWGFFFLVHIFTTRIPSFWSPYPSLSYNDMPDILEMYFRYRQWVSGKCHTSFQKRTTGFEVVILNHPNVWATALSRGCRRKVIFTLNVFPE